MNIKGLLGPQISPNVKPVEKVDRAIQSDQAHDRDANGQQAFGGQQEQKPPMSEEQIEQAMEALRQMPALKEHKWTVHLEVVDHKKFVLVKDNLGQLIRRIPENDLWSLKEEISSPHPKGILYKKSA